MEDGERGALWPLVKSTIQVLQQSLKFQLNKFQMQKEVCRDVPKEVCHLGLANPHKVKRPMQLKWCTKKGEGDDTTPTYQTSYLPPPGAAPTGRPFSATATPTYKPPTKFVSQSPALASFDPPTFNQVTTTTI